MLKNRSIVIGTFILIGIGGLIGLIMSLLQIDFGEKLSIKASIIILFSMVYLLMFLIIIVFLKVYENSELPSKELKTKETKRKIK